MPELKCGSFGGVSDCLLQCSVELCYLVAGIVLCWKTDKDAMVFETLLSLDAALSTLT